MEKSNQNEPFKLRLSTAILMTIGVVDLVSTLYWLSIGGYEGNPTFARILEHGEFPFVAAKLLFLIGPIVILEIVRQYKPHTAEIGTRIAASAYLILWLTQIIRIGLSSAQ